MNDENDKPKDDDWGMTMPHIKYEEKKKAGDYSDEYAPHVNQTPPSNDDWGMTTPNLPNFNAPNDYSSASSGDFDKTTPNINLSNDIWDAETPSPNPIPANDWSATAPNINLPTAKNQDDWEMDAPNFNPPPAPQKNEWSMPTPVFRVSEGENIDEVKKTAAFKLSDLQGFDMDTLNFKPSAPSSSLAESFDKTTPNFNFQKNSPPVVPNSFAEAAPPIVAAPPVNQPAETVKPAQKNSSKLPLVIGGLFTMMLFAAVFLAGVYFLFFNKPIETASKIEPPVESQETDKTITPTMPLTTTPPTIQPTDLPKQIEYKGAMMLVAAGEFTMGSDTGANEAKPAHKVVLPAYYIDKTEVTNGEYKKFCDATGKPPPMNPHIEKDYFTLRPNAPVVGVSFADAKAYADWAGKRLPTEEEWEKAASWDEATKTKREFPWGNDFQAKNAAFRIPKISDVGKFAGGASPSGALDMAGNVLEWVDAFFQPYPNSASSNPEFGETNRVVRGGHFASKSSDSLKTTKRIYIPPTIASGEDGEKLVAAIIGFRCAVLADAPAIADVLKTQGK